VSGNSISYCSITSSVDGSTPANVLSTGWTTGFRSYSFYTSGATFIKLSFKASTQVTKISFQQLNSASYAQISKYQISYSDDDISYYFLAEVFRIIF
jgi:hypothetical protein